MRGNIFSVNTEGTSGCTFLPGPGKDSRQEAVCKQANALKEIKQGEWGELYELTELRRECCLSEDPATREQICPAYPSLMEGGRCSCWAR